MTSLTLSEDELELLEHLLIKEMGDLKDDEPMRPTPEILKSEVLYTEFLRSFLIKIKKLRG